MRRLLILMAFCFFSLFFCKGYKDLTVNEFETMLAQDQTVQLLDVRTPGEFAENHLPGALNIDWRADGFAEKAQAQLTQDRPVLVYCRSGRRSAEAAATLDSIGFKTYNMKGGIMAWTAAGKRVTKYEVERFRTASGVPLDITLIKHGSLEISYKGLSIQVDPVAGDTEDVPEMAELKHIDVAFLPVNQPYTMTPEQCVAAAKAIGPKVFIPYHFSQTDLGGLPAALPEMDVRLRQRQ